MAFPPPVLPIAFTNADPQQDSHPAAHNAANLAINDTVAHLQFVEASIARYGTINTQSGQSYAGGQVANLGWSQISDPSWGSGAVMTVPAGTDGVYGITTRIAGPQAPAGGVHGVWLSVRNTLYACWIPAGQSEVALGVTLLLAAGDQIWVQIYNARPEAQSFAGNLVILRVGV